MKFLAILRDSLRETIDTKVFYVMVALSGLLTLFALGITFEQRPAKECLEWMANASLARDLIGDFDENTVIAAMLQKIVPKLEHYEVVRVEALDDTPAPADARYRFVLRRTGDGRDSPAQVRARLEQQFGRWGDLRMVEVIEVKALAPSGGPRAGLVRRVGMHSDDFELTTAPTAATRHVWKNEVRILYGLVPVLTDARALPLGFELYFIESGLVIGIGGWVTILVSVIITAFFIPNMLRKGTVDLLLVKPVRRPTLLVYKYVGGLAFIFLNTAVAVGGVWLALGLRSGVWGTGFLWTILILTFFFAILYSVSVLFGVLTQSPIAAILLTCGVWLVLFLVGLGYQIFEQNRVLEEKVAAQEKREPQPEGWFGGVVRTVHSVLPRTSDLGQLNARLLSRELITANQLSAKEVDQAPITWGESLTVSLAFIAVMLGLACWRFGTKDY